MAKVNIKNLGETLDRIRKAISEIDDETFKEIGKYAADRVVMKARTGKTMITGQEEPLKPLSANYIKSRQALAKNPKGKADPDFFSPRRSNLTLTGQYLKSIVVTKIDKMKRLITIEPTGDRTDGPDNKTLAGYLAKQGRNIFGIDKTGRQVIKQKVLRALRNQLRSKILRK